jgi:hypothetical protein
MIWFVKIDEKQKHIVFEFEGIVLLVEVEVQFSILL